MRALLEGAPRRAGPRTPDRARHRRQPRRRGAATRAASLIGAIIAGGENRRFGGAPKGLEVVGGRRIIDRVASALGDVVSEIIVVSNAPDAAEWISGARVVRDVRRERGSIVGLHAALSHAAGDVLAVAWDMPFVTGVVLAMIQEHLRPGVAAAVPATSRGPNPLCAAYSPASLSFISQAIDEGDLRLWAMLERLPSVDYLRRAELERAGDPEQIFFNVNDGGDLEAARAMADG